MPKLLSNSLALVDDVPKRPINALNAHKVGLLTPLAIVQRRPTIFTICILFGILSWHTIQLPTSSLAFASQGIALIFSLRLKICVHGPKFGLY